MSEDELIELFDQQLYQGNIDDFIKQHSPDENTTLLYYVLRRYSFSDLFWIVTMLLDNGADITKIDPNGNTVLMLALLLNNDDDDDHAYKNTITTSILLLTKIIDNNLNIINVQNKDGKTALMLATDEKFYQDPFNNIAEMLLEFVKMLLKNGADITLIDNDGNNALMHSISNGAPVKIIMLLLLNIIDNKMNIINVQNKDGNTALMLAVNIGWNDIMEMLLDNGADINITDKDGNTALMLATYKGDWYIKLVKMLLDHGADINVQNKDGNTVLMLATRYKAYKIAEILINSSADINIKNTSGNTALMLATRYKAYTIAEILINSRADITIQNREGNTVLMLATINNNQRVIKTLHKYDPVKLNAIINLQNNSDNTALMIATETRNPIIIKILLGIGADINIKNTKGQTVFDMIQKFPDKVAYLRLFNYYLAERKVGNVLKGVGNFFGRNKGGASKKNKSKKNKSKKSTRKSQK